MCNDFIETKDFSLRCVDILYSDQENKTNGRSATILLKQKEMVFLDVYRHLWWSKNQLAVFFTKGIPIHS